MSGGILGKKLGMTEVFSPEGKLIPVTVIAAGPCRVVQKRNKENDGYDALVLGWERKKKLLPRLREFRVDKIDDFKVGQEIGVDIFKVGDRVKVAGRSIGKGFAGTVKRWHFGRGPMAHGSKFHRRPGSIGAGTSPGNIKKGKRMAGRLGGGRVTVKNLMVIKVDLPRNLLLLQGAVPGKENNLLEISRV